MWKRGRRKNGGVGFLLSLFTLLIIHAVYWKKGSSHYFCTKKSHYVDSFHFVIKVSDPIVTGSSIFALKYKDGVMMCTDTLGKLFYVVVKD